MSKTNRGIIYNRSKQASSKREKLLLLSCFEYFSYISPMLFAGKIDVFVGSIFKRFAYKTQNSRKFYGCQQNTERLSTRTDKSQIKIPRHMKQQLRCTHALRIIALPLSKAFHTKCNNSAKCYRGKRTSLAPSTCFTSG